ncbi:hypothetical protein [Dendrosporobacter sp. 1207_IL3150]|uniref:hypothetical protein n=1 Tax=Dendrosporobacter sp. 1207_IL3150 TaxID=3084054 RepID=UPI002FD95648
MLWSRMLALIVAFIYLWLYPSMFLVPDDYRDSFWSLEYNISRKGIVVSREVYEIEAFFSSHTVYKVGILSDGQLKEFWVANNNLVKRLVEHEIAQFVTRGDVIVMAEEFNHTSCIISRFNEV